MALAFATSLRNARSNEINTALNAGSGAAKIRIYDGTRPATGGTTTTLLGELTCSDPASAGASNGVLDLAALTDDSSADAGGTATWFRMVDSDNNFVMDGNVGTSGSDLNLNSTTIVAGGIISVTQFEITEGNA